MFAILLLAAAVFGCGPSGGGAPGTTTGQQPGPTDTTTSGGGGGGGSSTTSGGGTTPTDPAGTTTSGGGTILPPPTGWVTLGWNPYTDPKATGLNVYVSQSPGVYAGPYKKDIAPSSTTTVVDGLQMNNLHYFTMTASDATTGLESAKSNEASAFPHQ